MQHPVATETQHAHELAAVELFAEPRIQQAFEKLKADLLASADPSPDMRSCFDWALKEVAFGAVVWSTNTDPHRPKVVTITRLEHEVDGVHVPGTRWGLDNPDAVYRVIPIDGSLRYRIHGRVFNPRLTENYFTLWDDAMNTIDVLSGKDLHLDADGRFSIDVDADPRGDRRNHIRSSDKAKEFYIRDVVMDWATETPNELEIELVSDVAPPPALTRDEQIERTIEYMERFIRQSHGWSARRMQRPANEVGEGWNRDTGGALRDQVYAPGWFDLPDGKSLLLHLSTGGAEFFTVPMTNLWGTTLDIVDRTSSMNRAQSEPNADGTYTFVVAREDPGVHNWIDPCGLGSGMLTIRFAEFPEGGPDGPVGVRSELVDTAKLDEHLPAGAVRVDASQRARQQQQRARDYLRRLPEVQQ